jgi:hypothetical protein
LPALLASRIATLGNIVGRQIVHKRGVFAWEIRRLDMIRKKFDRIGRADVMLVTAPCVGSHFLDGVLSDANLAILDRSEAVDPVIEQMIEPASKAFGLFVPEIAKVERCVLKLSSVRHQVSKHGS